MVIRILANFICTFLFTAFSLSAIAQENHFIYIQTENSQPFYVRLDGKVISSSAAGYLILPKLKEGDYQLIIGFPRNESPEKVYPVSIKNQNEGFFLKKLDDQYSLFNLETLTLVEGKSTQAEVVAKESKPAETKENKNAFTSLLAAVVKDSSLLAENPAQALAEQKKEEAIAAVNNRSDSAVDSSKTEQKVAVSLNVNAEDTLKNLVAKTGHSGVDQGNEKTDVVQMSKSKIPGKEISETTQADSLLQSGNTAVREFDSQENKNVSENSEPSNQQAEFRVQNPVSPLPGPIKRLLLMNESDGLDLVYLDKNLGDTIRMFMPVTNMKIGSGKPTAKIFYNPQNQDTTLTITPTIVQFPQQEFTDSKSKTDSVKETEVLNRPANQAQKDLIPVKNEKADTALNAVKIKRDTVAVVPGNSQVINSPVNSDCKNIATEKEFNKLWKRMLTRVGDDNMIDEAKKFFRKECFTVEQIRELSKIFLYDKGKYNFFDAAYPYASDSDMYYSLESELRDPYYINRFKAMIQK